MSRRVFVSLLPSLIDAARLPESSAVVIDVLRASTTICAAFTAGATRVVPFGTIDDARRMAAMLPAEDRPLLGGERGGVKIDGFDLGNSPLEYTTESVGGRTVLFTTTNGTQALIAVAAADRVFIGTFSNLSVLVERLAAETGDVNLVCAGTDGQVTLEDVIGAGAIAAALLERDSELTIGNDEATVALGLHLSYGEDANRLDAMRSGLGGANLIDLGYDADIEFAARVDACPILPVYHDGSLIVESEAADDGDWAI